MKINFNYLPVCLVAMASLLLSDCAKNDAVQDVDQTAALRNVSATYKNMGYYVGLPLGALTSGKTFQQLRKEDSVTYTNPANYSIALADTMLASNKKDNAADAKFDGMTINVIMNSLTATPVQTLANAFIILKNTTLPVAATGSLNLKTHRLVGLYMFHQIVDGNPLLTTLSPTLNYKIAALAGTIPLPDITQNIPTRADSSTRAFLSGLINSGVFDKP